MSETASPLVLPEAGRLLGVACRCCGERRVEMVLDLSDQPHCNRLVRPGLPHGREPRYPLRLGFCQACTMVQIDHTIPKEVMFSDYPYVSGTTATLPGHFAATTTRLAATYGLGPADLVVDIGSNDGTWLKQYARFGCRVLGVEAAANIACLARAAGVDTWNRFFDASCAADILAQHGPARLVTAAGVFFHLEDLHGVVRAVEALLHADGVFVVQAIWLGGMVENTAFDQVYHEHLCYYTLRSLSALLKRHGLEVFEVSLLAVHGGTIEAHVARKGRRPIGGSVPALREEEHRRGLGDIACYQAFARRVLALRERLVALLCEYRAQGRPVWAYGAPAKGATLLNSFGIGPDLVQQAVERNPMKLGLEIPGVRIPIVAESPEAWPAAYLVLAWNFLDEFLANPVNLAFMAAGGEFIVPVPDVRVIRAAGTEPL